MTAVGIVGGGQLGLMTARAAEDLGIPCRLLARPSDECAVGAGLDVTVVEVIDESSLRSFASTVDVITFDHEPVDLDAVEALEAAGVATFPGSSVLHFSDKAYQRRAFAAAGLPVPRFDVVDADVSADRWDQLGARLGWPLVLKLPRGGYDGRGVWVVDDPAQAAATAAPLDGELVVEEALALTSEVAAVVVRSRSGESAVFPVVDTVQRDGICHEVIAPCSLSAEMSAESARLAEQVADVVGVIGVMAVELFVVGERILVNEVAPRPHNSGHLTIEGCATSQYHQHLRAVLGMPLEPTNLVAERVVMVNVLGGGPDDAIAPPPRVTASVPDPSGDPEAVFVHLYGKTPRAGRKVGHVTALGHDRARLLESAHRAATNATVDGRVVLGDAEEVA